MHLADIEDFLFEIVNLSKGRIAVLKSQVAFFEKWGSEGLYLLVKISRELEIPIIMDAKTGDIGSTSQAYANACLGDNSHFYAGALTVNPWMGLDTISSFIQVSRKK